ncbi:hypothetical protein EDEG_02711 [Edhazardia aedis USNM 41457]|uniref:Exonuclease domain-containing protein n=1 Tax=Edhazardia aedis (strain USNM 41457) TaxID=1003232 RepID=J9DNC4_EDHAE|nr:hypothetical protein EDEG_02711 [Edhazardia aedis USNM 41457]|eukprot:EJW02887.1 hypothetical protein EDEG_02711 [Edhazardia aedis USNM 41457]
MSRKSTDCESIEIKIKNVAFSLVKREIQELLMWTKSMSRKPRYIGISNRYNLKNINIYMLKDKFTTKRKDFIDNFNQLKYNFNGFEQLRDRLFQSNAQINKNIIGEMSNSSISPSFAMDLSDVVKTFGFRLILRILDCNDMDDLSKSLFKRTKMLDFEELCNERKSKYQIIKRKVKQMIEKIEETKNCEKEKNKLTALNANGNKKFKNDDENKTNKATGFMESEIIKANISKFEKTNQENTFDTSNIEKNNDVEKTTKDFEISSKKSSNKINSEEEQDNDYSFLERYSNEESFPINEFIGKLDPHEASRICEKMPKHLRKLKLEPDFSMLTEENLQVFIQSDYKKIYNNELHFADSMASICNTEDIESYPEISYSGSENNYHHILAFDCEMVESNDIKLLARISFVDKSGNLLYDKFIEPKLPITDYKTEYSGISEETFSEKNKSNIITYEQLLKDLGNFIHKNTILVGHSLCHDLAVLKIKHKRLIDTSFLFRTKDNRRLSLKKLASKYLNKSIQSGSHCSIEDARTTLELLTLKVEEYHEYHFGNRLVDLKREILFHETYGDFKAKQTPNGCINIVKCTFEDLCDDGFHNNYQKVLNIGFCYVKNLLYMLL